MIKLFPTYFFCFDLKTMVLFLRISFLASIAVKGIRKEIVSLQNISCGLCCILTDRNQEGDALQ